MSDTSEHLGAEVVQVCQRMYQRGYIVSCEGNVSVSLAPDRVLITPRGLHKGFLRIDQLVVTDLDGRRIHGKHEPSSEIQVHLAAYRERPDVRAVVHAHPTAAVACSLAGVSLADAVVPEMITVLGAIPTVPYATPGTSDAAASILPLISDFDAILMERHGSVTVGPTVHDAYCKLETLEHTAQILMYARLLGRVSVLPAEEVARLLRAAGRDSHPVRPNGGDDVVKCP